MHFTKRGLCTDDTPKSLENMTTKGKTCEQAETDSLQTEQCDAAFFLTQNNYIKYWNDFVHMNHQYLQNITLETQLTSVS